MTDADTESHLRYYSHAPYQEFANHLVFGHHHEPFYVPATPFRALTEAHADAHEAQNRDSAHE